MPKTITAFHDDELGTLYFESSEYINAPKTTTKEVEVTRGGITRGSDSDEKAGKFEDALQTVRKVAEKVVANIASIANKPDTIECKIGVSFSADAGVIFAKVGSECNLELTLTWEKEKPKA
jgi:Trypsin-co-occurring domain 1